MGKEYRTRDGREVVILATNGRGLYPIVGQVLNADGEWEHYNWTADGFVYSHRSFSCSDLIEVKPVRVFERWVNIDKNGLSYSYNTPDDAASFASRVDRIACLHIRQEYKEGDGLCDSEKT
jgi:hypothetical protein